MRWAVSCNSIIIRLYGIPGGQELLSHLHILAFTYFFKTHIILSVVTQVLTTHAGVNPAEVNGIEIQTLRNLLLTHTHIILLHTTALTKKF